MAEKPTTKLTLPWKVRFSYFLISTVSDASRRSNATINRRLWNLVDLQVRPKSTSINGVSSSDVTVDASRKLWFRLYIPSSSPAVSAASLPVIVYFHGGGFTFCTAASTFYDTVCRLYSRAINAVVVSINYRLTPEHRYPSQYNDGFDVLKFLDENGTVLPKIADVSKCCLAGDSAGANLAHHVAVRVCKEKLRTVKVIGLISVQPFFGGEERTDSEIRLTRVPFLSVDRTDWHWKVFLPNGSNRDHEASNVSGPNAVDISGLDYPNTIVFMGGFDPLRDWQRKYYEWLRKSGKEAEFIDYPNAPHAFYVFPELPLVSLFISHVKEFVTKQLSNVN
ncbi:unnamed protein product [Sphenostylis stenocarpa]|uniref:Alpha/beta hydrolase fold-3 domain-containing protein n=1 Tax=Sphenostylis stenocarpa TaxID=92480 RepID=A0AA86SPD4_9FABA|nr:unnamed protein product [Sphenostylis stenocarpa]